MSNAIRDVSRSLVVQNNPSLPQTQVDVKAAEIILEGIGFAPIKLQNVALTVDITRKGTGGLDIGDPEPGKWYYIWIIARSLPSGIGLLSLSSDNPTMPNGCSYKALVGAVFNNSNGFNQFVQIGLTVATISTCVLNRGPASVSASSGSQFQRIDCSIALPEKAVKAIGDFTLDPIAGQTGYGEGWLSSKTAPLGTIGVRGLTAPQGLKVPYCVPVAESQTLYYGSAPNTNVASVSVDISGFEFA